MFSYVNEISHLCIIRTKQSYRYYHCLQRCQTIMLDYIFYISSKHARSILMRLRSGQLLFKDCTGQLWAKRASGGSRKGGEFFTGKIFVIPRDRINQRYVTHRYCRRMQLYGHNNSRRICINLRRYIRRVLNPAAMGLADQSWRPGEIPHR